MATFPPPLNIPATREIRERSGENASEPMTEDVTHQRKDNGGPPVLVMFAYFLGLGSIAIVAVGGQFPWFTVAPATVLLLVTYFRHVEATYARNSSS